MPINSRTKGKSGEREIVNLLKAEGFDVSRNLDQTRDGGFDIVGLDGIALEVKRAKKPLISKWWSQAKAQAVGKYPVLAYRLDNQKWRVIVECNFMHNELPTDITTELIWEDFVYFLRERA